MLPHAHISVHEASEFFTMCWGMCKRRSGCSKYCKPLDVRSGDHVQWAKISGCRLDTRYRMSMHSCTVRQIVSATAISLRETDVHSKLLLRSLIVLLMYDHKPSSTASDLHLKLHVLDCISHRLFCAGQCILDSLEEFGICSPGHRSQTSRQSGHLVNNAWNTSDKMTHIVVGSQLPRARYFRVTSHG